MKRFSDIATRNQLANFLGIRRKALTYILYEKKVENCYKSFEIPKKNGDIRNINTPEKDLKSIQSRLAKALWDHQKIIWKEKNIS